MTYTTQTIGIDKFLLCDTCGAVVGNTEKHDQSHDHFERLLGTVERLTKITKLQQAALRGLDQFAQIIAEVQTEQDLM